jgi:predicted Rossmann fold flavoprotein
MSEIKKIIVIGGGAAGFFAAVEAASKNPESEVMLLEKTNKLLSKVKVSGGGRCNVTHSCFDLKQLASSYPRGGKELLQAFHQFSPKDTIAWFEQRGVPLKVEADGRMFPQSNTSQSIIDCLMEAAQKNKVSIKLGTKITGLKKKEAGFVLILDTEKELYCDKLIIASGGSSKEQDYQWLKDLGHRIVKPIPSLFTFNLSPSPITELMGVSIQVAKVSISGTKLVQQGPLLITHWGFSGPCVLKLSAWGAVQLFERNYKFEIRINWLPNFNFETLQAELNKIKISNHKQQVTTRPYTEIPKRLWEFLVEKAGILPDQKWADISKKQLNKLSEYICNDTYQANGKTTFKEEFVTCGGVSLEDVDFKTMQSKRCANLFFCGEVLDIDGITGGFNFQAAWTSGWIAANNV